MSREDIAVALTTSFRSSLIAPFSTPELRAAFEQLKDFVRVNATAGEIEFARFSSCRRIARGAPRTWFQGWQ